MSRMDTDIIKRLGDAMKDDYINSISLETDAYALGSVYRQICVFKPDFNIDGLSTSLKWAFLRGLFDNYGAITNPVLDDYLECSLSMSDIMINSVQELCDMPLTVNNGTIYWRENNAIDFLSKLYESSSHPLDDDNDQYNRYCEWTCFVRGLSGCVYDKGVSFDWKKTDKLAHAPFKSRASDSGYDLTLISKIKNIGRVELYDTGIQVKPDYGWFFYLVGRSSIIKSGYMLANSVGIIDRAYAGNIMVPLIKLDDSAKDLELPARLVQIIPAPIIHMKANEVHDEDFLTSRGSGGFGSTDKG
ncbi:MAG: hypothetical protein Q8P20_00530 [bacterium]|nr:hypothetical protein [bacterium]